MTIKELIDEKNIQKGDRVVISYLFDPVFGTCDADPQIVQSVNILGWNGSYEVKVAVKEEGGKMYFPLLTLVTKLV